MFAHSPTVGGCFGLEISFFKLSLVVNDVLLGFLLGQRAYRTRFGSGEAGERSSAGRNGAELVLLAPYRPFLHRKDEKVISSEISPA